jgi:Tfp pilus assembly protein PilF
VRVFASHSQRAIAIAFTAIAICFALVTARESTYWWQDHQLFEHSVKTDPHHVEGQIEMSRLALEREDYVQAVALARGAIEQLQDPAHMEYGVPYFAHTWLGTGLVRLQQPAAARAEFHTALQQFPNSPKGHANLAMAEVALGNMQQAKLHFERSLELNPADTSVRHNLSLALLQAGDFVAAESQLERLTRDEPSDAAHRARLAWAEWKQGKFDAANENLERARRQSPQDPIVGRVAEMMREDQPSSANELN